MGSKSSLKKVLTFNFILVVTLPIILISAVMLYLLTKNLEREITNEQIHLTQALAVEFEGFLNEQQSALGLICDHFSRQVLDRVGEDTFLESIINNYPFFDMVQIIDNKGLVAQVAPYRRDFIHIDLSGQPFFREAKDTQRSYWSAVFLSWQTGQPTIAVTRPLLGGMVIGYLNLSRMNDMIDRVYIGETGWAEAIDRHGTYISHTVKSQVYHRVNVRNKYIVRQGLAGRPGSYRYRENGKEILAGVAVISQTGWPIIINQPAREAFVAIQLARDVFLGGTVGALSLAIVIALGSLAGILRPLAEFAVWAKKVATGNYDIWFGKGRYREFDELAEDFLMMTEAIRCREQALRESEERYALAIMGVNDGLWDWEIERNFFYVSARWREILGDAPQGEMDNRPQVWLDRIHPNDRPRVLQAIDLHFQGKSLQFHEEHRIAHQNGSYFWVLVRGVAIRDQRGRPYRMAGSLTDISERRRNEEQIKTSLREKEVLLQEIHHRVKNNMQVISSLLRLQSGYAQDDHYVELLKESQNRIRSMSLVHEKLYQSYDLTKIELSDYLRELTHSLLRSYAVNPAQIELRTELDPLKVEIDTAIPCGLVVNELISNALKYAFPGERTGVIFLSLKGLPETGGVELTVGDNGVGLPEAYDPAQSGTLGLQLVSVLVRDQLRGEMSWSRSGGTRFQVRFGGGKGGNRDGQNINC